MNEPVQPTPGEETLPPRLPPLPDSTPIPPVPSLARVIARRTTDLIAISLMMIAGLSIGRSLVRWWSVEEADLPSMQQYAEQFAGLETSWGEDGRPVDLQFGDSPLTLRRQRFAGPKPKAFERLAIEARRILANQPVPATERSPKEEKLIEQLLKQNPILEEPGQWRIDQIDGPMSLIVGTRYFPSGNSGNSLSQGSEVPSLRLISWGLAFPSGTNLWTLYTFLFDSHSEPPASGWPSVVLPSQANRLLRMESAQGTHMMGFTSGGTIEEWRGFFQTEFGKQHWTLVDGWDASGDYFRGRFHSEREHSPGWIEVQLIRVNDNFVRGLVSRFPVSPEQPLEESHQ